MIMFENLNKSPMSHGEPDWQHAVVERVEREYQDAALEASAAFEKALVEIMPRVKPGYVGTAIAEAMRKTNRYAYIKGIQAPDGDYFDAEIDLLMHTVSFEEI